MNYQIIPRLVESTKVQVVSISCNEVPQCDSYRKVTPMMDIDGWDDTGGAGDSHDGENMVGTKYRKVTQLAVLFRPKLILFNKFTNET